MVNGTINFCVLKGKEILPFLSDLASLRISIFKEYPYLYLGSESYEQDYLSTYAQCDDFILVLVKDNNKMIGASTALPLKFETDYCIKAFNDSKYNVDDIFYFGESVLLPAYRKRGVYKTLFKYREEQALSQGYKYATFCAVVRDINDQRKPKSYTPLDTIWQKYGYIKLSNIKSYFTWQEIGEDIRSEKEMIFWLKELSI